MLSYFQKIVNWSKTNKGDLTVIIGVVLVALAGFGAGQLFSFSPDSRPIIIYQPAISQDNFSASVKQSLPEPKTEKQENGQNQKMLADSANSNKYHWPDCPAAKNIAPQNQIWFSSEEEARAAGYIPCGNFEKYRPAANGY